MGGLRSESFVLLDTPSTCQKVKLTSTAWKEHSPSGAAPQESGCGAPQPMSEPRPRHRQAFGAPTATAGPTPAPGRWQQRRRHAHQWQRLSRENYIPKVGQDQDSCPQGPVWASVSESRRNLCLSEGASLNERKNLATWPRQFPT